ncbi:uncharacterized protein LOC120682807 isoform X1 [Panicum virgatum]|uniref:DUF4220 domain-containing protein n=1 Tax=Panicum virgatum TaxID=38727 RepID=A0A8T0PUH1_PANVG|nr:uncharacterized protein LOC120682807 isoform X1 [Panicum virgatum]XP_039820755.1 uncharacterized protein LOC120682807 isoform X1 [Panicum virgatum]XP_039820757.1 uncharacterized protein LOC120682807 isoform X1 [Panicum virgatum]XP_039820758.1 uncharacterized protein LOC120682807 isoform X1 [Panicum virgatum]KAG2564573.1 hypothetical protein PVAP13_7NG086746 [Panicum virgatum]KAG2564581.1 hypothetical protein PVAP13_7NG086746 [Panicum virgatum]KAG2564582.1 hypothetical protein PVAP13_7NG086
MMRSEVIEAGRLVNLWNEWGIQILVLVSFSLQVFLLVFGGIRRRSSSSILMFFLWSAYLLADSTAIYTLGHLSVDSRSDEHELVAFWAPFLLLHLGGPDNITAYALEDNTLWLRHLQTLAVQVLGAAYVIYEYIVRSGTLLLMASISMFVAGLLKYGERIWALKCGNISSIRNSISARKFKTNPYQLLTLGTSEEELLLGAHSQFDICKGVFADIIMAPSHLARSQSNSSKQSSVISYLGEDLYKLVEMELTLMYDFLYTKAAVIHTWYGFCIHFISLLGTATTFMLFQLSINSRGNGYSRVDVIISYVLLVGALVLEIISVCRALLSTWTCSLLHRRGRGWEWPLHVITSLGQRVHPASRRLWSGSIGQYNLFHLCTRNTNEIGSRLAMKLGLQDWWNKMHFSGTFSHSEILSIRDIKKLVLQALQDKERALQYKSTDSNSRGSFILKSMEAYDDFARWSVNIDFDESILVWHIATEVYIRKSKAKHAKELIEATEILSDYMMFLLVVKPNMLPGAARHNIHLTSCEQLEGQCRAFFGDKDNPVAPSPISWNPYCMFKELFHRDGPNCSRIPRREKLAEMAWSFSQFALGSVRAPNPHGDSIRDSANMYAILLANELLSIELRWQGQRDPLELILGVWVEMLLYAANHCSQESHARQLSNGCEFITIVSLLAHHFKYYSGVSRGTEDGGGNSPTGGLDKFASFTPETAPRSSGKTEN